MRPGVPTSGRRAHRTRREILQSVSRRASRKRLPLLPPLGAAKRARNRNVQPRAVLRLRLLYRLDVRAFRKTRGQSGRVIRKVRVRR